MRIQHNNVDKEFSSSKVSSNSKKSFLSKKNIFVLSILFIVVILFVWDNFIDPPAFWRFDRQQDKKAILEYVQSNYPKTIKRKGGKFPFQLPAGPQPYSVMNFELDGINFYIYARDGKVAVDGYYQTRAIAQFDKIIQDGFLKPRNITASTNYNFRDSYREEYPYTGGLGVEISISDQGSRPRDLAIYEFYKFWQNEGTFLKDYRVDFYIYENHEEKAWIVFNKETDFSDENEFYSAIERNKGILINH